MDNPLQSLSADGYAFKTGDWVGPIDAAEDECATCDERRRGCSFCCGRKRTGLLQRLWEAARRG